tara:strand:- start:9858 stop:10142 length:285 start_codon:yes stop_codon:yes gene_type:complete
MTTIEVSNITYESNRIQECKIIINGKEFNAKWEDPEYSVTDKKGSKGREDLGADDEELPGEDDEKLISKEKKELLGKVATMKANAIVAFKRGKK